MDFSLTFKYFDFQTFCCKGAYNNFLLLSIDFTLIFKLFSNITNGGRGLSPPPFTALPAQSIAASLYCRWNVSCTLPSVFRTITLSASGHTSPAPLPESGALPSPDLPSFIYCSLISTVFKLVSAARVLTLYKNSTSVYAFVFIKISMLS